MRRIFISIVGVALLGMMACSSHETASSIAGPSAIPTATTKGQSDNTNYTFTATLKGTSGASQWHGDTTPSTLPATGHPGHVTLNFADPLTWGATLSWDKMHHGSKALCTISNNVDTTVLTVDCGDQGSGSIVVYPTTTTTYTFKNKENADNSNDPWQIATATVPITTSVTSNIIVKWEPKAGYDKDDPVLFYTGKATGALSNLQVDGDSAERCGLGGGGMYSHFHATLTFVPPRTSTDGPAWNTTYTGNTDAAHTCGAATGQVTLTLDTGV